MPTELLLLAAVIALQLGTMLAPPIAAVLACRRSPAVPTLPRILASGLVLLACSSLALGYWVIFDEFFGVTPRSAEEIKAQMNTPGIVYVFMGLGAPLFLAPVTIPISLFLRKHLATKYLAASHNRDA